MPITVCAVQAANLCSASGRLWAVKSHCFKFLSGHNDSTKQDQEVFLLEVFQEAFYHESRFLPVNVVNRLLQHRTAYTLSKRIIQVCGQRTIQVCVVRGQYRCGLQIKVQVCDLRIIQVCDPRTVQACGQRTIQVGVWSEDNTGAVRGWYRCGQRILQVWCKDTNTGVWSEDNTGVWSEKRQNPFVYLMSRACQSPTVE